MNPVFHKDTSKLVHYRAYIIDYCFCDYFLGSSEYYVSVSLCIAVRDTVAEIERAVCSDGYGFNDGYKGNEK